MYRFNAAMLDTDFVSAREKNSRWLMIALHGLGDSMEGYRWVSHELRLPWLNYLLVNAPDPYHGGFSWYDYERDAEIDGAIEDAVVASVVEHARTADAVLVSDDLKGVISRSVAGACVEEAKRRGIPVLVDPKVPHIDYYEGATVITPNHHEAESITNLRIRTADEARTAAELVRSRTRCESVLITRGEHGMWLLAADGETNLPAEAREVSDVTGAGDTVIAALALGLAAGASLSDAAQLANRAAGVVVGKFGPATVNADEIRASRSDSIRR